MKLRLYCSSLRQPFQQRAKTSHHFSQGFNNIKVVYLVPAARCELWFSLDQSTMDKNNITGEAAAVPVTVTGENFISAFSHLQAVAEKYFNPKGAESGRIVVIPVPAVPVSFAIVHFALEFGALVFQPPCADPQVFECASEL